MEGKREIYKGKATIMNIGCEELPAKQLEKLPECDRECALQLVFDVQTAEKDPRRFDVKVEISHRELTGKALEWNKREDGKTPTQIDIALKDLKKQELLPKGATEADIGGAVADANLGREVTISVTEGAKKDDGTFWPPRARFVSPYARLTGAAAADRLAAFLSGKPAPKVQASAAEAPAGVPAPKDDPNDMPF